MNVPSRALVGIENEIHAAISGVVDSGWWLNGPERRAFEAEFADYCGSPHCVGVANGTDGLELALRFAGTMGGEVITAANAGGYTTTAARLVGATPVYVDVTERAVLDIEKCIAALRPETMAIVATHLFGNTVDIGELQHRLTDVDREDVVVIEDCSQAHGATVGSRRVGSMGDIGVFSFYPTKNLGALGDAGAVTCQTSQTEAGLRELQQYGWTERYRSERPLSRNSRMDEIQAAALRVKLPHLDRWNTERSAIVARYTTACPDSISMVTDFEQGVGHLAVISTDDRERAEGHLDAAGVAHDVHFPILDPDQVSQSGLAMRVEDLTMSRRLVESILTIPCFPGMTEEEITHVANALSGLK